MEMNQKLEVQSRQESIVLERVQVSDQRNSQLTSDVRLRDELLDEAKKAIDQARQLACAEQKRHSAVTSELNCHIKTLAHEVERQRGRADAAEDALRREKSNTQRLQELVIQARTGGASPAAVCRPHPSSGMRRSSRCSSTHYSGSSQPEHCSSPMVVMATTAMSTGMPLQRSSSPSPSHFSTSSPSPHVAVPQPWNGSQGCLSMTSSIRSDRSSSPASASFSASLPGSPKMRGVAGPSPSSSPLSSPRSRHQHMASFVSPPPPQLPSNTINPAFSAPNPRPMHSSTSPPPQHNNDTPWSHQATRRPTPLGLSLSPSDAGASSPFGPVLIRFEPEWQVTTCPPPLLCGALVYLHRTLLINPRSYSYSHSCSPPRGRFAKVPSTRPPPSHGPPLSPPLPPRAARHLPTPHPRCARWRPSRCSHYDSTSRCKLGDAAVSLGSGDVRRGAPRTTGTGTVSALQ